MFQMSTRGPETCSVPKYHQEDINAEKEMWVSVDGREQELVVAVVMIERKIEERAI